MTTITILLLAIPALSLLAILLSMSYQLIGRFIDERVYPPHGKRVDVGGDRLYISMPV